MNKTLKKGIATGATILALGGGAVGADTQINPYEDRGSHQELSIKHEIPQNERVEISKEKAEMTLRGWNDEYTIKITPQIPSTQLGAKNRPFTSKGKRPLLSKKIEYKQGDVTAFIEPKNDSDFDIDFTLDKKPDTNVFEYKIDGAEEFEFWYQPELTAQEIAEGTYRPENVIGSYAVYHKEKANHKVGGTNYATGKAFHIYRPKAIDAKGKEVWAELSYNAGILSVKVPQDFLNTAKYPVIVDPTFGYTSVGVSAAYGSGVEYAIKYTLTEAGEASSVSVYTQANTTPTSIKGTIYNDNSNYPGALQGVGDPVAVTTSAAWFTSTLASPISLVSGTYWLGWVMSANQTRTFYDTGTTNQRYFIAGDYTPDDPYPVGATGLNRQVSIYATYTATGGTPQRKHEVIWFE